VKAHAQFVQLIPHADVLFLNKHYAQANSPGYATSPRAFLLSLTSTAPPHALLVAYWGSEGAAVLSLPTKEYFQSSGWVEERNVAASPSAQQTRTNEGRPDEFRSVQSVRSGSDFWAGHRSRTSSSEAFTSGDHSGIGQSSSGSRSHSQGQRKKYDEDGDNDSQGTEVPGEQDGVRRDESQEGGGVVDEVGAQDAFVAGMIYALSRKIAPGSPYTPSAVGENVKTSASSSDAERGRWRLDECLRCDDGVALSTCVMANDLFVPDSR
jgi:hypothetical protein